MTITLGTNITGAAATAYATHGYEVQSYLAHEWKHYDEFDLNAENTEVQSLWFAVAVAIVTTPIPEGIDTTNRAYFAGASAYRAYHIMMGNTVPEWSELSFSDRGVWQATAHYTLINYEQVLSV